jgi:hypothetical protein
MIASEHSARVVEGYERAHRERVRRTLAAVEERIRTRRDENEARYRERMRRVLAAATSSD